MRRVTLDTPLAELDLVPVPRLRQLDRIGLRTVSELLFHFPNRYEDRNEFDRFPTGETAQPVCVCGMVKKVSARHVRGFQKMLDVVIEDENADALTSPLTLRWFNSHWVEKMIATGHRIVVYGKPKLVSGRVVISHPEFEIVDDDAEESIHLRRIAPIHGATEGLSPRVMRRLIWEVLERLEDDTVAQLVPPKLDGTSRAWALRQMHFPANMEALAKARRHLVLEEFLAMQLAVAAKRTEAHAERGAAHCGTGELMRRLHESLPFSLTGAQQRTIEEIRADLALARPMNRLLHGDVGSGKTLVALSAMLLCVESGYQAALMAPTQILAEQHYLNFRRLCDPLGLRVALRTGSRKEDAGALPLFDNVAIHSQRPELREGSARVPRADLGVPPESSGARYSKRRLPHYECPHAIYSVTFSTRDRTLLSPEARTVVLDAIRHFHGVRYELHIACVMPNHVHIIFQPYPKTAAESKEWGFWSLSELMHSIKSFSAKKVNAVHGETGVVWEKEFFDKLIHTDHELEQQFDYIAANPQRAGVIRGTESYRWIWTRPAVAHPTTRQDAERDTRDACAPLAEAPPRHGISDDAPHIFVGTHALLYEGAGFSRLGLAVIDEQHKFGVLQRARLHAQAGENGAPDVLVMTATPIPRTLTMTLYGDLDVSTLDELPRGRGKIVTGIRPPTKLPDAAKFIREHLEAGRQCYIVYPLIDESERVEAKAAAAEFKKWSELLAPMKCELLHGRIPAEEKDATMERFRSGVTKALIATTVIEVGIDVPNANIMLIENAERFGLAQLHQLRGRIGRGEHKSYCVLITSSDDAEAMEKLRTLERTNDGFEIAEADLRLRGPGDLLGTAQSGLAPLKLGDLFRDAELMKLARNHAFLIFEHDPQLTRPEHAGCRTLLAETRRIILAQVS